MAYCHTPFNISQKDKTSKLNSLKRSAKKHIRRTEHGGTIIEFVVIFPLVLVLVGGVIDWSLYFCARNVAKSAARSTAREMAVSGFTCPSGTTRVSVDPYLGSRLPQNGIFKGFYASDPAAERTAGCVTVGGQTMVDVSLSGRYNFMLLRMIGFNGLKMVGNAQVRLEGI